MKITIQAQIFTKSWSNSSFNIRNGKKLDTFSGDKSETGLKEYIARSVMDGMTQMIILFFYDYSNGLDRRVNHCFK